MTSIRDVQDYWNRRPCNIKHSPSQIGSREYFDEVEARKYFVEPHIPKFANFHNYRGRKVLEIGCGIGTDAMNFMRSGALYTGVELSEESLSLAKRRADLYGLSGDFILGNVEELSHVISEQTFDLIYSFGVLHHTPNISKGLEEIRKFCSNDTTVKVMLYAKFSWKSAMIEIGLDQPEAQSGCPIANSYSREEVNDLFNSSGFKVKDISQAHIFPYKIEKYLQYEYEFVDWFKVMDDEMFRKLETVLGWHLLIEAQIQ